MNLVSTGENLEFGVFDGKREDSGIILTVTQV